MAGWCSQSSTHMPAPPPKHVQQSSGPPINTRAILLRGGLRRATGAGGRSGGAHACARAQRAGLRAGEVCRGQRQRDERPGAHKRAPLAAGAAWPANESNAADALLSWLATLQRPLLATRLESAAHSWLVVVALTSSTIAASSESCGRSRRRRRAREPRNSPS